MRILAALLLAGLKLIDEGSHGNLTMSSKVNSPCQNSESTLGKGDVRGLEQKY